MVGYCRLSRDDSGESYSSIEEQQKMISDYVESKGEIVQKFYIDDNVSGYKFDRPQWNKMMEDIESNVIDTIVVKDISRIGRNNGKTLVFLDDLKASGKNLIVLHDAGGIYNLQEDRDDTIGITTWYNERYVKDISRKIKSSFHSRQKSGRLIMGIHFGYDRDPNDKTKLIADKEVKPIIQKIYDLYLKEGLGYNYICSRLNELGYITPSAYFSKKYEEKDKVYKRNVQKKWCTYMVKQILSNEIYAGTLVTHKKENKTIRGNVKILPEDEWYKFDDHHEPMISKQEFNVAKDIRMRRNNKGLREDERYCKYIFSGLLRCGECGASISGIKIRRANGRFIPGYTCNEYRKYGISRCCCGEIKESYLMDQFVEFVKQLKEQYFEVLESVKNKSKDFVIKSSLKSLENKKRILQDELKLLLNQKIKDVIKQDSAEDKELIEKTYEELENDKKNSIYEIDEKIKNAIELEKKLNDSNYVEKKVTTAVDVLDKIILDNTVDKYTLNLLVEKIYVYRDKSVRFELKINIDEFLIS